MIRQRILNLLTAGQEALLEWDVISQASGALSVWN
jgi:hypothetical protein